MNFAFPALLVFVLALPGIILRYTYSRGGWLWSSPTSLRRLSDEFAFGVVLSIPLHVLALGYASLQGFQPDIQAVLLFLVGHFGKDDTLLVPAIKSVADHYWATATYFLALYSLSAALGYVAHHIVRTTNLDLSRKFFRFDNYWYYMLRGEVVSFGENLSDEEDISEIPDGVYLSGVVTHGSTSYLYRGIVADFTYNAEGALDTVALTEAQRRELKKDVRSEPALLSDSNQQRYYDIRGDFLVLRCSEMQTMNLDYFWLDPVGEPTPPGRTPP